MFEVLTDFPCVKPTWKPRRVRKLRSFFKPIPSDPCFLELMMFDITRNRSCVTFRLLRLFRIIDIIRSKTIQCHVWPPDIVLALKFFTEKSQMTKVFNDRYTLEPFVLQGFDDSLCDRNWSMFSYSSKTRLYVPAVHQFCKDVSGENTAWSEIMCFGAPCFSMAISKAL